VWFKDADQSHLECTQKERRISKIAKQEKKEEQTDTLSVLYK